MGDLVAVSCVCRPLCECYLLCACVCVCVCVRVCVRVRVRLSLHNEYLLVSLDPCIVNVMSTCWSV